MIVKKYYYFSLYCNEDQRTVILFALSGCCDPFPICHLEGGNSFERMRRNISLTIIRMLVQNSEVKILDLIDLDQNNLWEQLIFLKGTCLATAVPYGLQR